MQRIQATQGTNQEAFPDAESDMREAAFEDSPLCYPFDVIEDFCDAKELPLASRFEFFYETSSGAGVYRNPVLDATLTTEV